MKAPPFERYAGREQAYIKHFFLASYLEHLVHKVSSRYDKIVYVDGFSGPWQSEGSDFADTSFGIALEALRTARGSWRRHDRDVKMKAVLVEKSRVAFDALLQLQPRFPDIEIKPFHGDFRQIVGSILSEIPQDAFAFVLIDPKGWRIPIDLIQPLIRRPNTEVVFNFMFEFINRAASMSSQVTVDGLDELLPAQGWREALAEIDEVYSEGERAGMRRRVLLDTFRAVLRDRGDYGFVADVPIMRPVRDRMLYSLVYATRSSKGIEVFRDCQIKTLHEQEKVRGVTKASTAAEKSGQGGLFDSFQGLAPDPILSMLAEEQAAAEAYLLSIAPTSGAGMLWKDMWPPILERYTVRLTELKAIGARLRKEGRLEFPNWENGKRVPDDSYRVRLA